MSKNLTCNQVMALLEFYISGELNPKLKEYIDAHLSDCSKCRSKVRELKKVLKKFNIRENKEKKYSVNSEINTIFMSDLSAYMDKELDAKDNIKVKKVTVSNPDIRFLRKSLYSSRNLLSISLLFFSLNLLPLKTQTGKNNRTAISQIS